jgi:hypothetical protein
MRWERGDGEAAKPCVGSGGCVDDGVVCIGKDGR